MSDTTGDSSQNQDTGSGSENAEDDPSASQDSSSADAPSQDQGWTDVGSQYVAADAVSQDEGEKEDWSNVGSVHVASTAIAEHAGGDHSWVPTQNWVPQKQMSLLGGGLLGAGALAIGGAALASVTSQLKLEQAFLIVTPTSAAGAAGGVMSGAIGMAAAGGGGSLQGTTSGATDSMNTASATLGGSVGGKITFFYNPEKLVLGKGANWESSKSQSILGPVPQFKHSKNRTLTVDILLDASTSPNGNVHDDVLLLFETTKPTMASMLTDSPCPPAVIFGWGSTVMFPCYMEQVDATYTLFRPNGTPLRAECKLVMKEIPSIMPFQNPTSGSRETRRTHTTVAGDTLQSLANREYRKPTMWRAIAESNNIDDPLRVRPGTSLLLPPAGEATALA